MVSDQILSDCGYCPNQAIFSIGRALAVVPHAADLVGHGILSIRCGDGLTRQELFMIGEVFREGSFHPLCRLLRCRLCIFEPPPPGEPSEPTAEDLGNGRDGGDPPRRLDLGGDKETWNSISTDHPGAITRAATRTLELAIPESLPHQCNAPHFPTGDQVKISEP